MQFHIRILTAAALLLHSIFGCGLHDVCGCNAVLQDGFAAHGTLEVGDCNSVSATVHLDHRHAEIIDCGHQESQCLQGHGFEEQCQRDQEAVNDVVSPATAGTQSLSGPFGIAGPEGCGLCIHCEEHPCHDSGPLGHCDMACNGLACSFVQSGTVDFNFEAPFATFIEGDCLTPLSDPVEGTGHRTQSWGLNRLANPKSVLAMHCTWRR